MFLRLSAPTSTLPSTPLTRALTTQACSGGTTRLMLGTKPTQAPRSSKERKDCVPRASFMLLAMASTSRFSAGSPKMSSSSTDTSSGTAASRSPGPTVGATAASRWCTVCPSTCSSKPRVSEVFSSLMIVPKCAAPSSTATLASVSRPTARSALSRLFIAPASRMMRPRSSRSSTEGGSCSSSLSTAIATGTRRFSDLGSLR
mmetsp:Transcript_20043/g.47305  ORF Transcript_20043/g.47305 Transcript_20043/m.47305 type:complete len:202 (-) Transcript_20043:126-731(-)